MRQSSPGMLFGLFVAHAMRAAKRTHVASSSPVQVRTYIVVVVCTSESAYRRFGNARSGHRFYSPSAGRWLNRDPILETRNVTINQMHAKEFVFVSNDPCNSIDLFGLWEIADPPVAPADKNTVGCDKNSPGGMRVQVGSPGTTPQQEGCIAHCIYAHEDAHMEAIKNANPNICDNVPDGHAIAPTGDAERINAEIDGILAELRCLRATKSLIESCLGHCTKREEQMQDWLDFYYRLRRQRVGR